MKLLSSWPGLSRLSRSAVHGSAKIIEMPGTRPGMTPVKVTQANRNML
jgi:hypothetical protein